MSADPGSEHCDAELPEARSEWVGRETGNWVMVIAVDLDNPQGPKIVVRYKNGDLGACSVTAFHRDFEPACICAEVREPRPAEASDVRGCET